MENDLNSMTNDEFVQYWKQKAEEYASESEYVAEVLKLGNEIIDKKQYPRLFLILEKFDQAVKDAIKTDEIELPYQLRGKPFWCWDLSEKSSQ